MSVMDLPEVEYELQRVRRIEELLALIEEVRAGRLRVKTNRVQIMFPWGPGDTPWWRRWKWFWGRTGVPGWPCLQILVGLLYIRVWWPNTIRFYEGRALMAAVWLPGVL